MQYIPNLHVQINKISDNKNKEFFKRCSSSIIFQYIRIQNQDSAEIETAAKFEQLLDFNCKLMCQTQVKLQKAGKTKVIQFHPFLFVSSQVQFVIF